MSNKKSLIFTVRDLGDIHKRKAYMPTTIPNLWTNLNVT